MAASLSTTIGVFGYLPGQPDFVRVRAADREIRRLEDWLERGLHQARWGMGGGFAVAYPRLFHRFIFRPDNSERVVAGILCASVDCHKRPFPFVAFDLIPTEVWDREPATLVGRNAAFFRSLEELVRTVGPLSHIGQVHGQVASCSARVQLDEMATRADPAGASEEARYQNFLQETTCGDLVGATGASGLTLVHDLVTLLDSGQDPRLLRQALALPLGRPSFARELELRFYLSILKVVLARQRPTVTLFWQLGEATPGALTMSFREPTLDVFSSLIYDDPRLRGVYRLGVGVAPLARPLPGLTDATSLHILLEALTHNAQPTDARRREKIGNWP